MIACPGGPIVEIPERGRFIFERLSPGTIREEDYYEEFRVIPGGSPGTRLLVACPRGATDRRGKCRVGQRALRVWHERDQTARILKECKSGRLNRKRSAAMNRIAKDIREMNREGAFGSLGRMASGIFAQDAQTLPGRALQFTVSAVLGTLISIFVIRTFFPGMWGKSAAAASQEPPVTDGIG